MSGAGEADARLERVARAIARAHGLDPDADSGQGGWTRSQGGEGGVVLERQPQANWRLHEAEARVHLAVHDALAAEEG